MYNSYGQRRLQYVIGKAYPIVDDLVIARAYINDRTIASQPKAQSGFANGALGPEWLLPLNICEGSPCFASKGLLKAREQGLI